MITTNQKPIVDIYTQKRKESKRDRQPSTHREREQKKKVRKLKTNKQKTTINK